MYYKASFTGKCEACGKHYYGLLGLRCPKNDALLAGETLNAMADSIDAQLTKKKVESAVKNKNWAGVEIVPSTCPHCGKYQSWNPMKRPDKPVTKKSDRGTNIGVTMFISFITACIGLVLGGLVHGLVNNIVEAHIDGEWFFTGGAILGIIVGIVLGRALGKLGSKSDEECASLLKKYNEDMERFNRVNKEIQGRTYKNEPDVNLEGGAFTHNELYSEYLSKA